MDEITVGVIGAGRIGVLHVEHLAMQVLGVSVKTVCDLRIAQLAPWASNLGITNVATDCREVLSDPEIQVVIINTPTDTHVDLIKDAAEAGKDIFCEKPVSQQVSETRKVLQTVEETGVKLMVGFNRRFDPNHRRAYDHVQDGGIGRPFLVKITSRDPEPPPLSYLKTSGGLFFDLSIHDWDLAQFLINDEVDEVYATGGVLGDKQIEEIGDIDTSVAILRFKGGSMGVVDNSRFAVYGYDQRVEVFGSKGSIQVDNEVPNTAKILTGENIVTDKIPRTFLERYRESYLLEMREFIDCVRNNRNPSVDGLVALKAELVATAAMKSYLNNRPVQISEIDR